MGNANITGSDMTVSRLTKSRTVMNVPEGEL